MAHFSFKRRPQHFTCTRRPTRHKRRYTRDQRFKRYSKRYTTIYQKRGYRGRYSRQPRRCTYRRWYPTRLRRTLKHRTPMSYVTRTTSERESGKLLYEKITTKGLGKKFLPYISFSSHYNINMLDRYAPFHPSNVYHFTRKWDMVRVCGIRTHLNICVTPKSGFRIQIIMMQSNID